MPTQLPLRFPVAKSAAVLLLAVCTSCSPTYIIAAPGAQVPGAIRSGTLANSQLITDARKQMAPTMQRFGYPVTSSTPFISSVTRAPTGRMGSIQWQEKWIFTTGSKKVPVVIDFRQTGATGTDMNIHVPSPANLHS